MVEKCPQALAEIRAPIFEEKVVDHLLGQVKVTEKTVSREVLFSDDEDGEAGADEGKKAKKASKSKKKA